MGNELLAAVQPNEGAEGYATQEATFVYQRADGTIEHAQSVEDARDRCPVLGKMSLDQANVLLELASLGNEKLAEEAEKRTQQMEQKEELATKEPDQIKEAKTREPELPDLVKAEPSQRKMQLEEKPPEAVLDAQVANQVNTNKTVIEEIEPPESLNPKVDISSQPQEAVTIGQIDVLEQAIKQSILGSLSEEQDLSEATRLLNYPNEEADVVSLHEDKDDIEVAYYEVEVMNDAVQTNVELQPLDAAPSDTESDEVLPVAEPILLDIGDEIIEEPARETIDLFADTEEIYSAEVSELYNELAEIISNQQESIGLDEDTMVDKNQAMLHDDETGVIPMSQDFEEYISEQPITEESLSLEIIQEQANDQTVEKTLAQVLSILSQEPEPNNNSLALHQIIDKLRITVAANEHDKEELPQLTPELTEQLIRLLRAVGYEEPSDALVQCVSTHGFVFLWQAIEYVVSEETNAELGITKIITNMKSDDNSQYKITRFLFELLHVEPINYLASQSH